MTRKIRRTKDYDITLQIKDDSYIRPPRDSQRNWLLNRAIRELGDDLDALDGIAETFVPGGDPAALSDRTNSRLLDEEIMEDWQIPVMSAMVDGVTDNHGAILEIGFGRGVAADFIQRRGVRSHILVECNASVIERFEHWRRSYPGRDIRLIPGKWQDRVGDFGHYDGILFHTYPLNEGEFVDYVAQCATFAEHFFDTAAAHLNDGGVFTYLTNEIDSLSRGHQRALLKRFRRFRVSLLKDLGIPADTRDAQWADQTVLVIAEK